MKSRSPRPTLRLSGCVLVLLCLLTAAASAQYFGRNKVQWERFDFRVAELPHFDLHHYPHGNAPALDAGRMAERWYDRLSATMSHGFEERKPIVLYADHADFQQTDITGGLIGEGTGGFTEGFKDRVVMPLTGSYADTDHVLGHELVHAFQFDISRRMSEVRRSSMGLMRLPLWVVEGLAEYLSQGREDSHTAMVLRDGVVHDRLPDERAMWRDPRFNPYQWGQGFWAYVAGRWGDDAAMRTFKAMLALGVEPAIEEVLGVPPEQLFADWRSMLREHYNPVIGYRDPPETLGEPLLARQRGSGRVNLAPVLSPDGSRIAFLSTRDLFSLDLYVADARTGEVQHRLFSAAADPHLDSLRFLESAGTWSPDGRRFAFTAVARGDNRLVIVDAGSGRVERRIAMPRVSQMSSPAWSPDGRRIALSGMADSVMDLYVYDLESGETRQLTDDLYADMQPAWSPDGSTLAFVSDRGRGTDLEALVYAPPGLHLIDVATGAIRPLPLFARGKQISPAFTADGRHLYFVADPDGISDVFRYSLADQRIERITRVSTGVSGITALSPALSVGGAGDVAFSLLLDGEFVIHRLQAAQVAGIGRPVEPEPEIAAAALLPPPDSPGREAVRAYLDAPEPAPPLPPPSELEVRGYEPRLSLDFVGPVGVGLFGDRYGVGLGGSVSAYFSDLLGDHQLAIAFQGGATSDNFEDLLGAQALYLNRQHRLQWGVGGAHIPLRSAITFVTRQPVEVDGDVVLADVIQQQRERVVIDQVSALARYPLTQTRRFEASAGYTHMSFDFEVETLILAGNTVLFHDTEELGGGGSLGLIETGVAYVGDNSSWGFVSPVRGGRMRLGIDVTQGDLAYNTALADVRRYFFRRPWTLAVRGLHFGRYGGDAESGRLSPLYVGRETLVRGYAVGDIDIGECTPIAGVSDCPQFDRLVGSRIGVFNLELRVPLFGVEEYGLIELPALPTELALFFDGGAAWTADQSPELTFDQDSLERVPVFSAGIAARILLLGALPIELYYAVPFQRPEESGVFGIVITPGW
ncbi:MAG TPA: BamA/TamA family outer membrane protein [Thermoanaerobaculia bacterium]|nr:BamA/TamA family outer membrane protein [Thermoanaerobaculia bacterium]